MTFSDPISYQAVMDAVAEYDTLGQEAFLKKYGFGKAINYFLDIDGHLYDSKAIVGVAHGYEYPSEGPLSCQDFNGGKATVKPKLEKLGFVVRFVPI